MMSTFAPKGLKWTYDDYAQIPDDGRRHEIIDGEHFVNPSPPTLHPHVSKRLQYQRSTKIELAGLG
ncbi:MAG: Uma2 family endonuclease, partial [Planctomycetota bacterium]